MSPQSMTYIWTVWDLPFPTYANSAVEKIVGEGKNAHHEQFLLLLQCFQKTSSAAEASERNCMWEREG